MTYVIAQPCIDVKDMACVDVFSFHKNILYLLFCDSGHVRRPNAPSPEKENAHPV